MFYYFEYCLMTVSSQIHYPYNYGDKKICQNFPHSVGNETPH